MENNNDDNIIALILSKEKVNAGFNELVKKYSKPVYWHIRRMVINHDDADDLTQETFIKIWKNLSAFKNESKLYTWIYRIATNETLTFLNRKKKFFIFSIHDIEEQLSNALENDIFFSANEIELIFQKALLTLPQKQRIVFNMKYYDDLKYEDMSEILSTSVGALKASYHHAAKKIEKYLSEN